MDDPKTKVKSTNTNLHGNKLPKQVSRCICQTEEILIDSVFRTGKNYHPKVFSEEYKYIFKE